MANGNFGGGNGKSDNPFIVEDVADLNAIRNHPVATYYYYKLKNHLDMSVFTLPDEGWTPIPNFYGSFDGNYNCIFNLKINRPTEDNVGLFANMNGSSIVSHLLMVDAEVTGNDNVGTIVGQITGENVKFDTVGVQGKVNGHNSVGGMIGHSGSRKNIVVDKAVLECDVIGTGNNVGGLAGTYTSFSDDAQPCSLKKVFMYGTVSGENFITTNATVGLADFKTIYKDVYFDKDRIPNYYPDEHAIGESKSFFQKKTNFTDYLNDTYTIGRTKGLWCWNRNDYMRFSFANRYVVLFDIDGVLNGYDATAEEFVPLANVPQTLDWAYCYANGVQDISIISIKALRTLLAKKVPVSLKIVCESSKTLDAQNYPIFQILADSLTSKMSLNVVTAEPQDNLKIKDYNPLDVKYNVVKESEEEASNFELYVDADNEQKFGEFTDNEVRIIYDTKELDDETFELQITSNAHVSSSSDTSAFNDKRSIEIFSSKQEAIDNFELDVNSEYNKSMGEKGDNITEDTEVGISYDSRSLRQSHKTNLIYTLFNTIQTQNRGVHVEAHGKNTSRYLISVNNGQNWLSFNSRNNTWTETDLADIYDAGVTAKDLTSRAVMNALPTDYKSKVKIAAAISAEAFNSTFSIRDFDIEFEPNNGPEVLDLVERDNGEVVTISGVLNDKENDSISYRILTKHQIDADYKQILPRNEGGWLRQKNGYKFEERFLLSEFKNGANVIKIETKDSRGETFEKTINFTLIQGTPEIKINSNNQFYANITLSHTLKKKVRFQIYINGIQKAPVKEGEWSEWKSTETPFTFDYTWNTKDLLNGLPNELEIKVQDEMKTETFAKFNVIGEYKSLLFKDQNNFYYSTDTGEVLQQLDFGTVIGGVLSDVYPVIIENKTGLSMDNIIIYPDSTTQEELAKIKLSHTAPDSKEGFVSSNETFVVKNYNQDASDFTTHEYQNALKVPYVLDNNDTYTFYVRIESDEEIASYKNKVFRVLANGTPIDTSLITVVLPQTEYEDNYAHIAKSYLDDGEGLFNVTIKDMTDTMGINGKSIYLVGDSLYTWLDGRITFDEFMANPLTEDERQKAITRFASANAEFEPYSVSWLDAFFIANYGDTVKNLVDSGKLSFERRLRTSNYYDAHVAWLKADEANKDKQFTFKYLVVEK